MPFDISRMLVITSLPISTCRLVRCPRHVSNGITLPPIGNVLSSIYMSAERRTRRTRPSLPSSHLHTLGDLHILHLTVLVMMIHEPGNCIDLGTHTPQQIRSLPDHHRITTSPHHHITLYHIMPDPGIITTKGIDRCKASHFFTSVLPTGPHCRAPRIKQLKPISPSLHVLTTGGRPPGRRGRGDKPRLSLSTGLISRSFQWRRLMR